MPILYTQLDNYAPPTWLDATGATQTALRLNTRTSEVTSLRPITNADKVNYFTSQRVEGDLFYRDVCLDAAMASLIHFVGVETGQTYSIPLTRLQPGKWVSIANAINSTFPQVVIVALGARTTAAPNSLITISVYNITTSTTVQSSEAQSNGVLTFISLSSETGNLIPEGDQYEIRLTNGTGSVADVEGTVILQGRTY